MRESESESWAHLKSGGFHQRFLTLSKAQFCFSLFFFFLSGFYDTNCRRIYSNALALRCSSHHSSLCQKHLRQHKQTVTLFK